LGNNFFKLDQHANPFFYTTLHIISDFKELLGNSFTFDGKYPFIFEKDWWFVTGQILISFLILNHHFN